MEEDLKVKTPGEEEGPRRVSSIRYAPEISVMPETGSPVMWDTGEASDDGWGKSHTTRSDRGNERQESGVLVHTLGSGWGGLLIGK